MIAREHLFQVTISRNVAAMKTPTREAPFTAEKNVFVHLHS